MSLTDKEKQAVAEFGRVMRVKFGDRIKTLLLYGSKVRGDSDAHSDIDLFVLVDRDDRALRSFALEAVYEINLKYDVVLSVVICDQDRYDAPLSRVTPFFSNVLRDGVKIES